MKALHRIPSRPVRRHGGPEPRDRRRIYRSSVRRRPPATRRQFGALSRWLVDDAGEADIFQRFAERDTLWRMELERARELLAAERVRIEAELANLELDGPLE